MTLAFHLSSSRCNRLGTKQKYPTKLARQSKEQCDRGQYLNLVKHYLSTHATLQEIC